MSTRRLTLRATLRRRLTLSQHLDKIRSTPTLSGWRYNTTRLMGWRFYYVRVDVFITLGLTFISHLAHFACHYAKPNYATPTQSNHKPKQGRSGGLTFLLHSGWRFYFVRVDVSITLGLTFISHLAHFEWHYANSQCSQATPTQSNHKAEQLRLTRRCFHPYRNCGLTFISHLGLTLISHLAHFACHYANSHCSQPNYATPTQSNHKAAQ